MFDRYNIIDEADLAADTLPSRSDLLANERQSPWVSHGILSG
jgi:hypothetical protein